MAEENIVEKTDAAQTPAGGSRDGQERRDNRVRRRPMRRRKKGLCFLR